MQNKIASSNLNVLQNPRVRKSVDYRKTAQISVGVTANDKRRLIAAAAASEKRFSDFVREGAAARGRTGRGTGKQEIGARVAAWRAVRHIVRTRKEKPHSGGQPERGPISTMRP